MAYYPLFFDFTNQSILIIGGGKVALEKAKRLLCTKAHLEIIAPNILEAFFQLPVVCTQRTWKREDLVNRRLVIAATDVKTINEAIVKACQELHVLCNVVDDAKLSAVTFGAVILKENLSIGISTSGASPTAAKALRDWIQEDLQHSSLEEIVDWLAMKRLALKQDLVPALHSKAFHDLFWICHQKGRPLNQEEYEQFVEIHRQSSIHSTKGEAYVQ